MKTIFRNIKSLLFFPLALIPIGMLCYSLGTILATPTLIGTTFFIDQLEILPLILRKIGYVIHTQTGLITAIAVSIGLSRKSIIAVLLTMLAYFVMQVSFDTLSPFLLNNDLYREFSSIPMIIYPFYILGGVVLAVVVTKFYNVDTNDAKISLRKQTKAIITSFIPGIATAIILSLVWVFIIQVLSFIQFYFVGDLGFMLYGFVSTLLKPTGLTILYDAIQSYTYAGGGWRVPDPINTNVYGVENIWLAQLQYGGGKFTVGTISTLKYLNAMFVSPAIALAIINTSYVEHRKKVISIMTIFMVITILAGFSLPIEIILLFTSPLLFLINAGISAIMAGVIILINQLVPLNIITLGGGGIIEFIFLGIVPGVEKTGAWAIVLIGLVMSVLTYFLFYFMIKKFKLAVFGRNQEELEIFDEDNANLISLNNKRALDKTEIILQALGGIDNINNIYSSMYRLHVELKDTEILDALTLKQNGAAGVFVVQHNVQIIYGALTQEFYKNIKEHIDEQRTN